MALPEGFISIFNHILVFLTFFDIFNFGVREGATFQKEKNDAKGVNIGFSGVFASRMSDFRGSIISSAYCADIRSISSVNRRVKISNFEAVPLAKEYIFGLEIKVSNTHRVQVLDSIEYLVEDGSHKDFVIREEL